ncbi:MAG: asparaginase domain-containing protein [Cyclobacteriaceae bacterium]
MSRDKIFFIQTGGTIDKDYPKKTKGYAFEITTPAVERILEKLNPNFDFEIHPFLQKDSMEINSQDLSNLKGLIENLDGDKVIITHGTDTLIETAGFLSSVVNKTIILTGAKLPERFSNSDAPVNIGTAIGAAQTLSNGVYIAIQGLVIAAHKAVRNPDTGSFGVKQ